MDSGYHLDRYSREERDHSSLAVREYDPYQKEAKAKHRQDLREIVGRRYD